MTVIFSGSGSGGVGKSFRARALAQSLGSAAPAALVDANVGQQSQRAFFHVPDDAALEMVVADGVRGVVLTPKQLRSTFALLPGPHTVTDDTNDILGRSIGDLSRIARHVIVDVDRFDDALLSDRRSVPGGVMLPWLNHGARLLFTVGSLPSQGADGLAALDALARLGITCGVVVSVPPGGARATDDVWAKRFSPHVYLGQDVWTDETGAMIARGIPGFAQDNEPAWLRATVAWVEGRDIAQARNSDVKGRGWGLRRRN